MSRDAFLSLSTLAPLGSDRYRSPKNEPNPVGRVYGGQPMAQCVAAALATVDADRVPTSLQMTFLAGPKPESPIDYVVQRLQDGKRVSTRYVRGEQGERGIVGAFVSAHREAPSAPRHRRMRTITTPPERATPVLDLSAEFHGRLGPSGFLAMEPHPHIECRFADPRALETTKVGPIQLWFRLRHALPDDPRTQTIALAYLSDWWLAFTGIAGHLDEETGGYYLASLNHSIWFHAPSRADSWLLAEMESPYASRSRGLDRGEIFTADGALVASVAQECLQTSRV